MDSKLLPKSLLHAIAVESSLLLAWSCKQIWTAHAEQEAQEALREAWNIVSADDPIPLSALDVRQEAIERCCVLDILGEDFTPAKAARLLAELISQRETLQRISHERSMVQQAVRERGVCPDCGERLMPDHSVCFSATCLARRANGDG